MKTVLRLFLIITFAVVITCCNSSKPKKSIENLRVAFNTESTSAEKYAKFAQTALTEGFDTIARLFDAVSKSSKIHAVNHAETLKIFGVNATTPEIGSFEIKTTAENLQAAIKAESYEMQTMYTGFIKTAEEEKAPEAAKAFTWAQGIEKGRLSYFNQAAITIGSGNESGIPDLWLICPLCGNTLSPLNLKPICEYCLTKEENFIGYTGETK